MVVERDGSLTMIAPPVHDPEAAIELCREHQPDVVLMDIVFKGAMNGIVATRKIKEVSPTTKVVIMTAHDDERLLVEAVEAGASGFLGKDEAADQVLAAARSAAEGEVLIDPVVLTRLLHQVAKQREAERDVQILFDSLTDREWEVLRFLAQGKRNDDVGRCALHQPANGADARAQPARQARRALQARGRGARRAARRHLRLTEPDST